MSVCSNYPPETSPNPRVREDIIDRAVETPLFVEAVEGYNSADRLLGYIAELESVLDRAGILSGRIGIDRQETKGPAQEMLCFGEAIRCTARLNSAAAARMENVLVELRTRIL